MQIRSQLWFFSIEVPRLTQWAGLSKCILTWFLLYPTRRKFNVHLDSYKSKAHNTSFGVAQGSCLGPLFFSLYMFPLGDIVWKYINFHSYVDDTQSALELNDKSDLTSQTAISKWMSRNSLNWNTEKKRMQKTEILLPGPKAKRDTFAKNLISLVPQMKSDLRSLSVILDSEFSFTLLMKKFSQTAFFHIRNIAKVWSFLVQA